MGLTMSLNIEILNKTLIPMGKKGNNILCKVSIYIIKAEWYYFHMHILMAPSVAESPNMLKNIDF